MNITTRIKKECEKIENDQCEYGKFCLRRDGYSVGARKHSNAWTVHDVNSHEMEAIKAHPCIEIKAKKATKKKGVEDSTLPVEGD